MLQFVALVLRKTLYYGLKSGHLTAQYACQQETVACVRKAEDQTACKETHDKEDSWTMLQV